MLQAGLHALVYAMLVTGLDCQVQRRRNSSCSGLGLRAWGVCGPVPGQFRDMESPPKQVTSTYSDTYSNLERQAPSIAHKTFKKLNPAYLRHKVCFEGDYLIWGVRGGRV